MTNRDELIHGLLSVIDRRDWHELGRLVTDDICYDRPGYATIRGVADFLEFYRHVRIVADGMHKIERLLTNETQGFCWGRFEGMSKSGTGISATFADWYEFDGDRVRRRRTFFYQPSI